MDSGSGSKPPLKIGVFDSGIGALSLTRAIKRALPNCEIIYRQDEEHFPYGSRAAAQLVTFGEPILKDMVHEGCSVIVVACTTIVTTAMKQLQEKVSVPLIGIEPLIQQAVQQSTSKVIAVCASPRTLTSQPYTLLKEAYAHDVRVLEPECRDWPYMASHDIVDDLKVGERIKECLRQGADVIVLACTHYHWITDKIHYLAANKAVVIQPDDATVAELIRVLQDRDLLPVPAEQPAQ